MKVILAFQNRPKFFKRHAAIW